MPPTVFWPFDQNATGANGKRSVAPWNYQCPQCCHSGAQPPPASDPGARPQVIPWCDNVTCGVGPPCQAPPAPTPAPAPPPSPSCAKSGKLFRMYSGGMGSNANKDIKIIRVPSRDWHACCNACSQHEACQGWTLFASEGSCHLHANTKDQHKGIADRLSGVLAADA